MLGDRYENIVKKSVYLGFLSFKIDLKNDILSMCFQYVFYIYVLIYVFSICVFNKFILKEWYAKKKLLM